MCLGSLCTAAQSFEGINSGTVSSFIYHPAGFGEHARGCSEMNVLYCFSMCTNTVWQQKKRLLEVCEMGFFVTCRLQQR